MNFLSWLACSNQDPNRTQTWQNWWAFQMSFSLQVPLSFLCTIFFFLKCFVEGSRLFIPKGFQSGILSIIVHGYHSCKLVARSRDYWSDSSSIFVLKNILISGHNAHCCFFSLVFGGVFCYISISKAHLCPWSSGAVISYWILAIGFKRWYRMLAPNDTRC